MEVEKNRKVAILAHCLLNQNSKPYKRARYPEVVDPLLDLIRERDFALMQLPCPEIAFSGLKRWSQVIEQYDTPKYRDHCKDLSVRSVDQIEHYLQYNYDLLIFGVDGSPSCGIELVGSHPDWQGYPGKVKVGELYPVKEGTGVFMQELKREIKRRGYEVPESFGYGLDLRDVDNDQLLSRIQGELEKYM